MRENVQNELKRWLKKNKIIGYSKAILITFLITGGISIYAKENKYSNQIFFSTRFLNTKNEDNTLANFNTSEYDKDTLGNVKRRGAGFITRYNKFFGGNGIVLEGTDFFDTVSFSAKIKPKKVDKPDAKAPKTKPINISKPNVTAPQVKTIEVKTNDINVSEQKEIQIPDINKIEIKTPNKIEKPNNIHKDAPQKIDQKERKSKVIYIKELPTPEIKASVKTIPVDITYFPIPKLFYRSEEHSYGKTPYYFTLDKERPINEIYYWGKEKDKYIVSQASLTDGTFNITNDENKMKIDVKSYGGDIYGTSSTETPKYGNYKPNEGNYLFNNGDIYSFSRQLYGYMEYGEKVKIINEYINNTQYYRFSVHEISNFDNKDSNKYKLDDYKNDNKITEEQLKKYKEYKKMLYGNEKESEKDILFVNKGIVDLNVKRSVFLMNNYRGNNTIFFDNKGTINLNNDKSFIFSQGYYCSLDYVISNSGTINIKGKESIIASAIHRKSLFINDGIINIEGDDSIGIDSDDIYLNNPLNILSGKGNVGVSAYNSKGLIKIDIKDKAVYSVGVLYNGSSSKLNVDINIEGNKNIGIISSNYNQKLEILKKEDFQNKITIKGGENNIAIELYPFNNLTYEGNINILGGTSNVAIDSDNSIVNMNGNIIVGDENNYIQAKIIRSQKESDSIKIKGNHKFYLKDNSYIIRTSGTKNIEIEKFEAHTKNINTTLISASSSSSMSIKINNSKIYLQGKGVSITAFRNSKIEFKNGEIHHDAKSYAIYNDSDSSVDISNTKIYLKNGAVGFNIYDKTKKQNI